MKTTCLLLVLLAGVGFAGAASASLTCTGEKLLSNYFEERYVHDDGSVTVYYTTSPAAQIDIQLTLSGDKSGQFKVAAKAYELRAPSRILSGSLPLQSDGKTYMNLIGDNAGDDLARLGIAGYILDALSPQSSSAVFQITGTDYQLKQSFGVEHILLTMENDEDVSAAQIRLQCH